MVIKIQANTFFPLVMSDQLLVPFSVGQSIDRCVDVNGKFKLCLSKLSVYFQESLLKTSPAPLQMH